MGSLSYCSHLFCRWTWWLWFHVMQTRIFVRVSIFPRSGMFDQNLPVHEVYLYGIFLFLSMCFHLLYFLTLFRQLTQKREYPLTTKSTGTHYFVPSCDNFVVTGLVLDSTTIFKNRIIFLQKNWFSLITAFSEFLHDQWYQHYIFNFNILTVPCLCFVNSSFVILSSCRFTKWYN